MAAPRRCFSAGLCFPGRRSYGSRMRKPIKNPDQDPDLADFDVVRGVTGGETPEALIARRERELRRRPIRILERLSRKARKPGRKSDD